MEKIIRPNYARDWVYATHWVIETGRDCDGVHTRGRVWPFLGLDAAKEYAQKRAEWSDGLGYNITDKVVTLKEYCYDHQLYFEDYILVE